MYISIGFTFICVIILSWIWNIFYQYYKFIEGYLEAKRDYEASEDYFYTKRYHNKRNEFWSWTRGQILRLLFAISLLFICLEVIL